jgi:hypothetical protein
MTKQPHYQLILESEVLSGYPFSQSVIQLISQYSKMSTVTVYVPELSIEEVKKTYLDEIFREQQIYNDSSVRLSKLVKQSVPGIEFNEDEVQSHIDALLDEYGMKKLKTEYQQISVEQLVHKSIQMVVPFDQQKEKGFRNAILTETILQHIPALLKYGPVVFICPDQMLRQYLTSQTTNYGQFLLFSSLPEFESLLRLQAAGMEETAARKLSEYIKHKWLSTVLSKDVAGAIRKQFAQSLVAVGSEVPYTSGAFYTADPVFVERQKQPYIWSSTMVFQQLFWGYASVTEKIIEFTVRWWTWVDAEGKIEKTEIIDIVQATEYIQDPMKRMKHGTLRTRAGQSVTPVI